MIPETFLADFGHLADAPNGVQKVRELILQLAVSGRLVPQNPDDEPASDLLEGIEAKKKRIVNEGAIKKTKPLPPIGNDEIAFILPDSWAWTRLGNVTTYGETDKAELIDVTENTWVLELEDVEKVTSRLLQRVRCKDRQFRSSKNKFQKDDVIYGKLRPYLDKVLVADESGVCTTEMLPMRGYLRVFPEYLRWTLKAPYFIEYANSSTHGMNLPRLGTDKGRLAPFPLPPFEEQKRIVAKIDQLMALCDELEERQQRQKQERVNLNNSALDALLNAQDEDEFAEHWQRICDNFDLLYDQPETIGKLRSSILQLAVQGRLVPQDPNDDPALVILNKIMTERTELEVKKRGRKKNRLEPVEISEVPYKVPDNWEWVRFGHVALIASNLVKPEGYQDSLHVAPDNIEKGNGKLLPCRTIREDKVHSGKHLFFPGQILYSKIRPNLSKATIVDFGGLCSADMYPINSFIYTNYLLSYILSETFLDMAVKTDTRVAMPKINQEELNKILVPVPPLTEQKRIVAKVDQLMALCDMLEQKLNQAQSKAEKYAVAVVPAMTAV